MIPQAITFLILLSTATENESLPRPPPEYWILEVVRPEDNIKDCPSDATLIAMLASELGQDVFDSKNQTTTTKKLTIQIHHDKARAPPHPKWSASMQTGRGTRTFDAETCPLLFERIALSWALLWDAFYKVPQTQTTSIASQGTLEPIARSPESPWEFGLSLGAGFSRGIQPGTSFAPRLGGILKKGQWHAIAELQFDFGSTLELDADNALSTHTLGAALLFCFRPESAEFWSRLAFCGRSAFGRQSSSVKGPLLSQVENTWLVALGARLTAKILGQAEIEALGERTGFHLFLDPMVIVSSTRIQMGDKTLWSSPPFGLTAGLLFIFL